MPTSYVLAVLPNGHEPDWPAAERAVEGELDEQTLASLAESYPWLGEDEEDLRDTLRTDLAEFSAAYRPQSLSGVDVSLTIGETDADEDWDEAYQSAERLVIVGALAAAGFDAI